MTELEAFEYGEQRAAIFARDGWRCRVCGKPLRASGAAPQLAHCIPQNKRNLETYGERIIHHPLNLVSTESLECNAAVSIAQQEIEKAALIARIKDAISKEEQCL